MSDLPFDHYASCALTLGYNWCTCPAVQQSLDDWATTVNRRSVEAARDLFEKNRIALRVHCPNCGHDLDSTGRHAECVAPLDQLDGGVA